MAKQVTPVQSTGLGATPVKSPAYKKVRTSTDTPKSKGKVRGGSGADLESTTGASQMKGVKKEKSDP